MALSPPAPRTPQHTRRIAVQGYLREDGLFDIEAHLVDTKPFSIANIDRGGEIAADEPLHEMHARFTVDENMVIHGAEAVTLHGPFAICAGGAESFARLAGLTIRPGFLRAAGERLAGVEGCTHLRELLQQMATTAFQSMWPARMRRAQAAAPEDGAARLVNTCYAYADTREAVRRRWPALYRGDSASARK